jgi:hypothetical protein
VRDLWAQGVQSAWTWLADPSNTPPVSDSTGIKVTIITVVGSIVTTGMALLWNSYGRSRKHDDDDEPLNERRLREERDFWQAYAGHLREFIVGADLVPPEPRRDFDGPHIY